MGNLLFTIQLISNRWDLLASNITTESNSKKVCNYLIKHPNKIKTRDFIDILCNISNNYFKKIMKNIDKFYEFVDLSEVFADFRINIRTKRIKNFDLMEYIKIFIELDKNSFEKTINLYEKINDKELKTQILHCIKTMIKKDTLLALTLTKTEINTKQIISFEELENIILKGNNVDAMHEFGCIFNKSQNKILNRAFEIKDMDSNMQSFLNTAADFKPELYAKMETLKACERVHSIGNFEKEHETIIKIYDAIVDKYFNISEVKVKQDPSSKIKMPNLEMPIPRANNSTFIDENILNKFDESISRKGK